MRREHRPSPPQCLRLMPRQCRCRHFDVDEAAAYDEAASQRHGDWNGLHESLLLIRPASKRSTLNITVSRSRAILRDNRESKSEVQWRQELFDVAEVLAPGLRSVQGRGSTVSSASWTSFMGYRLRTSACLPARSASPCSIRGRRSAPGRTGTKCMTLSRTTRTLPAESSASIQGSPGTTAEVEPNQGRDRFQDHRIRRRHPTPGGANGVGMPADRRLIEDDLPIATGRAELGLCERLQANPISVHFSCR